jgi:hypothetical protein
MCSIRLIVVGAALHGQLKVPPNATILQKGADPEVDSYSAFFDNTGTGTGDTGLAALHRGAVTEGCVGGGGTFNEVRAHR